MTLYAPQWQRINAPLLCWFKHRWAKQWRVYQEGEDRQGRPILVKWRECRRCGSPQSQQVDAEP